MILVGEGVPVVDEVTRKPLFELPEHGSYWLVRNGKAELKIDADDGTVYDEVVDPANAGVFDKIKGTAD